MTEERLALLERAQQGDDEACRQMLTENAGLIWSIVKRYHHCGVEMDDLYQLGCIGFIKAVKGFDLTYGTQFSTYAVPKIAGEIRRFLRDDGPIKVGRTLREKAEKMRPMMVMRKIRFRLSTMNVDSFSMNVAPFALVWLMICVSPPPQRCAASP